MFEFFRLVGFGPEGWGWALLTATMMTLSVALSGFVLGCLIGTLIAWARLSGSPVGRSVGDAYTTILRGIPDLLVIYLFYFGGSAAISAIGGWFGATEFIGLPPFATGAVAIGIVSAAYQAEVFRSAYQAINKGEIEAAHSVGMGRWSIFRRITAPLVLRYALPGIGNTWQLVLKESALISVTGLVELLRQAHIAAGSTRRPFDFYIAAALLYLLISWVSMMIFNRAEIRATRGMQRAS